MKKALSVLMVIALCAALFVLPACGDQTTSPSVSDSGVPDPDISMSEKEEAWYVGSNLNGYAVPGTDENYRLMRVPDSETLWYIKVNFAADLRDKTYDGHWYKITDGTWDQTGSYGTESYEMQPPPVKYDQDGAAVGMGSIWIADDNEYTIVFDAAQKKIYDSSMHFSINPTVYGTLSAVTGGTDWGTTEKDAIVMHDSNGDGKYTALVNMSAYTGTDEGYTVAVAVSMQYFIGEKGELYGWGAGEQYLFDGTPGGMGKTSFLLPKEEGDYLFTYDGKSHVTTFALTAENDEADLEAPVLYGDFNNWAIEGKDAHPFTEKEDGTWSAEITLPKGAVTVALCLTKKNYGQYGWGAGEQYLLDGKAGGMGALTTIESAEETAYVFTYHPDTHITDFEKKQ
ncbi:MAG TPA: hypothetical protein PKH23_01645 [Bacillota bacterium]|nr:hypothetical protein [Bacillota bacterium]